MFQLMIFLVDFRFVLSMAAIELHMENEEGNYWWGLKSGFENKNF